MLPISHTGDVAAPAAIDRTHAPELRTRAAAPVPAVADPHELPVDRKQVEKAVATLNEFTGMVAQDVQFSIDEDSGRILVKVVDSRTQEVLRQLPSKEALAIAQSLDKMQGILIHAKA